MFYQMGYPRNRTLAGEDWWLLTALRSRYSASVLHYFTEPQFSIFHLPLMYIWNELFAFESFLDS